MGLFLSIVGFLMVPVALIWLVINFINKKKKLIPSLSIVAGIFICFTGLWIVGTNATPEQLAKIEEDKKAREERLEAARLEKEKAEKEEVQKEEIEVKEKEKEKETPKEKKKVDKEESVKKRDDLEKQKLKEEVAKEEKEAQENERLKKEIEAGRTEAKKFAQELIEISDGSIVDVRPTYGDDWIAVYVELDNSVHLLSSEEKRYVVESMGPIIESGIIESGATDYSDIYFIDQNGNTLASPKMLGGWKMKD